MSNVSPGLKGKRIVVTRAEEQASALLIELKRRGAIPYLFPLIQTAWPADRHELDSAILRLDSYDWMIFTSVNGVRYFFQRCAEILGADWEKGRLKRMRLAAVGPKTKQELEKHGLSVQLTPTEAKQEEFALELCQWLKPHQRVLFPRGQLARQHLREVLERHKIDLHDVITYVTLKVEHSKAEKEEFIQKLLNRQFDVLTFTSSSTVTHFIELLKGTPWTPSISPITVACIGPVTAQTAEHFGLRVDVQAQPYTVQALLEGLEQYFTA